MEKNLEGHDQLGWALAVSLAVHVVVAAAVILWPASQPDRQFFSPAYQVALVSGAALPTSGPPAAAKKPAAPKKEIETPKPAPKPEAKPEVKPKPAPPKPEPKPEPKEAIGSKKTVEPKRVKREEKKTEPEPSYEDVLDQRMQKMKAKAESRRQNEQYEDALSAIESKVQTRGGGGGATGPSGAVAMPGGGELSTRFMLYYTEVWERIRRAWVLPEALAGDTSGAMAVVALRINRDGSLNKFWLEESSGNARLDQSALRAVERAAPFPPLPADLLGPYHEVGLRFRPEDAGQ